MPFGQGGYVVFHDSYLDGEGVQDALIDVLERYSELQIIASPVIGVSYWRHPAGSTFFVGQRAHCAPG